MLLVVLARTGRQENIIVFEREWKETQTQNAREIEKEARTRMITTMTSAEVNELLFII